jgi:hypothetical protein
VTSGSSAFLRTLAALVVTVAACPLALFGGALLSCATQGISPSCALNGVLVSPVLLFAAGVAAGLLVSSWRGLGVVSVGVFLGMLSIPIIAGAIGNPVPIDPVQGVIAMIWFLPPVVIGYAVARGIVRFAVARRRTARG